MRLPCNVIEDMLPMYYDGVCSAESAAFVEEHLKDCARCSIVLSDLRSGMDIRETAEDDLKPLNEIERQWKKSRRIFIVRGICIALVALLLLGVTLSGIWFFSYGKYYCSLVRNMEPIFGEESPVTSADFSVEKGGYRFDVNMPFVLSNSGFVRVMDEDGLVLFLYPEVGGDYTFWLCITDHDRHTYSVYLKSDLTADFENHRFPARGEQEKTHIRQLVAERRDDIDAMLQAVYLLWGIDLLEYAPQ